MKFIHFSDLHLGKRVNEFSMIEEQKHCLDQIVEIIDREEPDAVLIAGDIYDRSTPQEEAVRLLDDFLFRLNGRGTEVYIISGNHDSAERLAFGSRIMDKNHIHISPVYDGSPVCYQTYDKYGRLDIYLLPFIKPVNVRKYFPEAEINSYTDALSIAIENMNVDRSIRNIIISHQFVTGADRSESEDKSVGGSDNVDVNVYDDFDYVALGHIHGPQKMQRETVRYSGSPIKYSFSEEKHKKAVTVVELKEKGNVTIKQVPLIPLRDMRTIRGSYNELSHRANYINTRVDDYIQVILEDEEDVPDAIGRLRSIYPNIMLLRYDNARTRSNQDIGIPESVEKRDPLTLFDDFYEKMNNVKMTKEQSDYMLGLIEKIWNE